MSLLTDIFTGEQVSLDYTGRPEDDIVTKGFSGPDMTPSEIGKNQYENFLKEKHPDLFTRGALPSKYNQEEGTPLLERDFGD
jgi:hypothetical protein